MSGEPAAVLLRVSSTGKRQSTENQDAPVYGLVSARGYAVQKEFKIRASVWKGKQQPTLDQILDGARAGRWSVVCVAALDRVERRGVFALHAWILALMQAGCRIESARAGEEWLADTKDELMWTMRLGMEADRARRESQIRSERVRAGHRRKESMGQGWISLPTGYAYETAGKFDSRLVVDREGAALVRAIITDVAEGATLQVAGRRYGRTPETIGAIVRQLCYSTGVLTWEAKEGEGSLDVPALIARDVQKRAIAAIEARRTWDGKRARETGAQTYAGRFECEHGHPWHTCYGPAHKDGSRTRYYRTKPRCGCPMLRGDEIDELVEGLFATQLIAEPETVTRPRAGAMRDDAAISKLKRAQVRMVQAGEIGSPAWQESVTALAALERAPEGPRWETVETGRTLGAVFLALDMAGRRQWLADERLKGDGGVIIVAGKDSRGYTEARVKGEPCEISVADFPGLARR